MRKIITVAETNVCIIDGTWEEPLYSPLIFRLLTFLFGTKFFSSERNQIKCSSAGYFSCFLNILDLIKRVSMDFSDAIFFFYQIRHIWYFIGYFFIFFPLKTWNSFARNHWFSRIVINILLCFWANSGVLINSEHLEFFLPLEIFQSSVYNVLQIL